MNWYKTGDAIDFQKAEIEQSIPQRFEAIVRRHGGRMAIKDRAGMLTYEGLNREANRLAHEILSRRGPGSEPVALLADHGRAVAIGVLGILKAGKIVVTLHPSNPPARIRSILDTAGVKLVITDEAQRELAARSAVKLAEGMVMKPSEGRVEATDPEQPISPGDPAWILHTSGSTGEAKGVFQSHRNMLHGVWWCTNKFGITTQDRLSCLLPCSVVGGMREILLPLLNGASLHPRNLKTEGLGGFADWLADERITVCRFISSVFRSFAGMLEGSENLTALRVVYLGGESLTTTDAVLFQRYFPPDCICVNVLGATETGIFRFYVIDHRSRFSGTMIPVGYPADNITIALLDDQGRPVAPGEAGEIAVTSRYLALGYWNQPELTRQCFTADPAGGDERTYRTGDLGRLLPDGCLEFLGRKDSQVSINGYRVEMGDVEAALLRLDAVADGVCATQETGSGHTLITAFVVRRPNELVSVSQLQDLLRRSLPSYMVPTAIVFVDSLPRMPNGKIDIKTLPFPKAMGTEAGFSAPRNRTERRLQKIWEKCLDTRPIGISDDFFNLGGDSLHAVQVMAHVAKEFRRDLRPATIFEAPTIDALAKLLGSQSTKPALDSLLPVRKQGSRIPFFWIHGDHSFAVMPRHLNDDRPIWGLEHQGQNGTPILHTEVETIAAYYLSEIRKVRPYGPYLIGGYSFGGMIAFDIAQTLRRAGEEVPLLFMLDSGWPTDPSASKSGKPVPPDGHPPTQCRPAHPRRKLIPRVKGRLKLTREQLSKSTNWWYCRLSLALRRPLPPTLRTFYTMQIYYHARDSYRPQPYYGNVVYVNCSVRGTSRLSGWKKVFKGPLETLEVPGNHDDMRREQGVRHWAPCLKRHLDAADPIPASRDT
jgi:amino acid adenylation domain-containing protein